MYEKIHNYIISPKGLDGVSSRIILCELGRPGPPSTHSKRGHVNQSRDKARELWCTIINFNCIVSDDFTPCSRVAALLFAEEGIFNAQLGDYANVTT